MKAIPRVLSPEEAKQWGLPEMIPIFPSDEILAIEAMWSKYDLQQMARDYFLSPVGGKDILIQKLIYIGALDEKGVATSMPREPAAVPYVIGDPKKFCCSRCGACAPEELLKEGRFFDRMDWLRQHYKEKHPGVWGKGGRSYAPATEPLNVEIRRELQKLPTQKLQEAYNRLQRREKTSIEVIEKHRAAGSSIMVDGVEIGGIFLILKLLAEVLRERGYTPVKDKWYLGEWWTFEYSSAEAVVYRSKDRKKRLYVFWDGTREVKPAPEGIPQTTPKVDLRKDYDEMAKVGGGTLYRKGNTIQVWWDEWGPETWSDVVDVKTVFYEMQERWTEVQSTREKRMRERG